MNRQAQEDLIKRLIKEVVIILGSDELSQAEMTIAILAL